MYICNAQLYSTLSAATAVTMANTFPNSKIILVGDPDPDLAMQLNQSLIPASLLAPPYNALQEVLDGDYMKFVALYNQHLMTDEVQMLFATIFAALYKGVTIILLFPQDSAELMYPNALIQYFYQVFHVQVGTETTGFIVDPNATDKIVNLMYRCGTINSLEYVYMIENTITETAMKKLIYQLDIKVQHSDNYQEYLDWVDRYHKRMVTAGKILAVRPFSMDISAAKV